MNDEIKEILEGLNHISNSGENASIEFNSKDCKLLSNCITNLQTIEQQYSAILSENVELENKITNLQEENERLKAYIKYLEEYKPNYYKGEKIYGIDYKSRIDKAIEYIKQNSKCGGSFIDDKFVIEYIDEIYNGMELLNILNGSDE